jgi:hypothetical protein
MNRLAMVLLSFFAIRRAGADSRRPELQGRSSLRPTPARTGRPAAFLLVHPRNAFLADDYTGCKVVWVMDAPDRFHRLMTLYFEGGKLRVALGYDGRGANELRATCILPGATQPGCTGVESHPLSALKLPTWPRSCTTRPDAPECKRKPD